MVRELRPRGAGRLAESEAMPTSLPCRKSRRSGRWRSSHSREPYPYRKVMPREDPYGIALLSRWPIDDVQSMDFSGGRHSRRWSRTSTCDGRKLRVIALHTLWPVMPELQVARDRAAAAGGCTRAHPARGDDTAGRSQPDAVRTGVRTAGVRVRTAGRIRRRGVAADVAGGILAARVADRSRAGAAAQLRYRA